MPFAGICGRVCHHPCETECYRGKLMEEPVSICALKRYISDEFYTAHDTGRWEGRGGGAPVAAGASN